jgi:hypothetical protein
MGAKENYEARKAAEKAKRTAEKESRWWFSQRAPIDRFTGWLVVWTALLFVATIGSAAILWKNDETLHETLVETQKSVEAAQTSADAAKAAVELSDKTAERQLRAYLSIESISFSWILKNGSAEVVIRNAGQTPASNMTVQGIIATGNDISQNGRLPAYFGNLPASFGIGGDPDPKKTTRVLGQGREETYTISAEPFTKNAPTEPFAAYPFRVFVIGAIYYTDIFGKHRYSRFCAYFLSVTHSAYCNEHNDAN